MRSWGTKMKQHWTLSRRRKLEMRSWRLKHTGHFSGGGKHGSACLEPSGVHRSFSLLLLEAGMQNRCPPSTAREKKKNLKL
jgi:hypothetical protein